MIRTRSASFAGYNFTAAICPCVNTELLQVHAKKDHPQKGWKGKDMYRVQTSKISGFAGVHELVPRETCAEPMRGLDYETASSNDRRWNTCCKCIPLFGRGLSKFDP